MKLKNQMEQFVQDAIMEPRELHIENDNNRKMVILQDCSILFEIYEMC